MSIPATQLRPGMIIKHNNDLHSVFSVEHRTPGNLRAFIQAKLRNLRTGAMFEHRFRSPDPIEKVNVDEENMEFLYSDGDDYSRSKWSSSTAKRSGSSCRKLSC
jgi:elongation factor P